MVLTKRTISLGNVPGDGVVKTGLSDDEEGCLGFSEKTS
jgi:hypothetical protein